MSPNSTSDSAGRSRWAGARSLGAIVLAAGVGLASANVLHLHHIYQSSSYLYAVTAVLAIGVYGSTSGIQLTELRRHRSTIAIALTVGVLAKAVLISLVMIVVLRQPLYAILLGVAVAQIDPVSVAAMITKSRMSESAKTILLAWSSFDDPVTMLLTVYLLAFVRQPAGSGGLSHVVGTTTSPIGLVASIGANVLFAGIVWFVRWLVLRAAKTPRIASALDKRWLAQLGTVAEICWLLAAGVFAVLHFYLLGLAVIGLFLRPNITRLLGWATRWSLLAATVALGLILTDGVQWVAGIALGASAYLAQLVTAPFVARRQSFTDRVHLSLGQQNGITAITLALLLEAVFPGTVGIVAPAVLVVNVLNLAFDAAWDRAETRLAPTSLATLFRLRPLGGVPVPTASAAAIGVPRYSAPRGATGPVSAWPLPGAVPLPAPEN